MCCSVNVSKGVCELQARRTATIPALAPCCMGSVPASANRFQIQHDQDLVRADGYHDHLSLGKLAAAYVVNASHHL